MSPMDYNARLTSFVRVVVCICAAQVMLTVCPESQTFNQKTHHPERHVRKRFESACARQS